MRPIIGFIVIALACVGSRGASQELKEGYWESTSEIVGITSARNQHISDRIYSHMAGKKFPSNQCISSPGSEGVRKLFSSIGSCSYSTFIVEDGNIEAEGLCQEETGDSTRVTISGTYSEENYEADAVFLRGTRSTKFKSVGKRIRSCSVDIEPSLHKVGNWEIEVDKDDFTDEVQAIASTALNSEKGVMVVKCDRRGRDSLYVSFLTGTFLGKELGQENDNAVRYRLDDGEPILNFDFKYDETSASVLDHGARRKFISKFVQADPSRLRLQILTYDGKLVNLDINTRGASEAVRRVADVCLATL